MGFCKRCGRPIRDEYLFCYNCNKFAKTYKDERGYVRFKDSDMPLHRYIAARKLGRELRDGEIVHHINRKKDDNRTSNLWVFRNQDDHEDVHEEDGDFDYEEYEDYEEDDIDYDDY
jgi:hypothetical protein